MSAGGPRMEGELAAAHERNPIPSVLLLCQVAMQASPDDYSRPRDGAGSADDGVSRAADMSEPVFWLSEGKMMTSLLDRQEIQDALSTPWPTEAELDAIMLEGVPDEDMPVRNRDLSAARDMTPAEIVRGSNRFWMADLDVQIATLRRLVRACEELEWPMFCHGRWWNN